MRRTIQNEIIQFVNGYGIPGSSRTDWRTPLVGFAYAGDPLFAELKQIAAATHAHPREILHGAETVITYFLPFDRHIPNQNKSGHHAAREWAVAYIETNRLIVNMNHHLSLFLGEAGFATAVLPPTHNFDKDKLLSDWSHKHVAYIAGLGKFGRHHQLITSKGCCGRLGSLITDALIRPDTRPEGEFCLNKHNQTCEICVKKCINGALLSDPFDRHLCYQLLLENAAIHKADGLADVCGKCTCIVPCSYQNPVEKLAESGK